MRDETFLQAWLKACVLCMSFGKKTLVFGHGLRKYCYHPYWLRYGKEEHEQLILLTMDELLDSLVEEWQQMKEADQRAWLKSHCFKKGTKKGGVLYKQLLSLYELEYKYD